MNLQEHSVDADCQGGSGQRVDELSLPARAVTLPAGKLHTVSGVEHHSSPELFDDLQGAHVDDEVVVSERSSPFSNQELVIAGAVDLVDNVADIPGGQELAFFDIHDSAGLRSSHNQTGLAAQKRRDLDDVEHLGRRSDLFDGMDVADDRNVDLCPNLMQNLQPVLDTGPYERIDRTPIGFQKGRLENERNAVFLGRFSSAFPP